VSWRFSFSAGRLAVLVAIGVAALLVTAVAVIPMAMVGGGSLLFAAGVGCPSSGGGATAQPAVATAARNSIPSDYLALFKKTGQQYGVPWVLLAGISKVESNDGQSNLPGVHSGQNGFGAAGPMQIGIGGASTNTWGGAPAHQASQAVGGVATDANGDGVASVYEPADAIAGAAKYLLAHGVQNNVGGAIFAYNHLTQVVDVVPGTDKSSYDRTALGFKFQELYPNQNVRNRFPSFNCGIGSCSFSPFQANWRSEGKTYAWTDNLTHNRGSHTFKTGIYFNFNDNGQQPGWSDALNTNFGPNASNPNAAKGHRPDNLTVSRFTLKCLALFASMRRFGDINEESRWYGRIARCVPAPVHQGRRGVR